MLVAAHQIERLLAPLQPGGALQIDEIKQHNHVYRVVAGGDVLFLKVYTKDWYGGDIAATAGCVQHERAAWAMLAAHGMSTPAVLVSEANCDNPLGRPVLVTRGLAGQALGTTDPDVTLAQLPAVGDYLRRMHAIAFDRAGYLMPGGPEDFASATDWRHPLWMFEVWKQQALRNLEHERAVLPPALYGRVRATLEQSESILAPAYELPRYTHGDCWPHQFFVAERPERVEEGGWAVTGVLDMEVASAGDAEADFVHFLLELAACLPATSCWWEGLFGGYGAEPDFERFRVRLLATTEA
ncbi:MAG TPA: aminoglycoside phosphotransferase family protein, partial [Roseiflexaceae bacterium]|nr:aminoglycoside phosphotransferase family protein [Roseiflexaceae bacterium]